MVLFLSGIIPTTLAAATPGTPLVVELKDPIKSGRGEILFTISFSYDKGNNSLNTSGTIEVFTSYFY